MCCLISVNIGQIGFIIEQNMLIVVSEKENSATTYNFLKISNCYE